MNAVSNPAGLRLSTLSLPAKLTITLFVALVGTGYLVALANIVAHTQDADQKPGLSFDDLRRTYHGLSVQAPAAPAVPSLMLREVSPRGGMRRQLDKGGEPAVRALTGWLEAGAKEADFDKAALFHPNDPSAQGVIAGQCIRCHNKAGGEKADLPYADDAKSQPQYAMVAKVATPPVTPGKTVWLEPIGRDKLIQITHAHMFGMPLFTLAVAVLFLASGLSTKAKLLLAPLPMLALCCEVASWWLARPFEPFVYVIAAAGAAFGISYGLQIACIILSMWLGKRPTAPT